MVKFIYTIRNIVVGWCRFLFKKQSPMARNRLMICKMCAHKERIIGMDFCGMCGCCIPAKVEIEDERCEDNRW